MYVQCFLEEKIPLERLLVEKYDSCRNFSKKLATSLIRVASTRIFNNPYQSILELPVNSIDSYRRMSTRNKYTSVGKFGMGFFSILYWVVNSKRKIFLYSKTEEESFKASITSKEDQIFLSVDTYWDEEGFGTKVVIDAEAEPFSKEEIDQFNKQVYKLFAIPDVSIIINNKHDIYYIKFKLVYSSNFIIIIK